MRKEVIILFIVILLLPFSNAQLSSINILDVNVNDSSIQVLIENNLNQDFIEERFIINNQHEIIKEEILSNFTAKFFIVNYPSGIKLETLKDIVDGNEARYDFKGNEDKFVINQAVSQTSELTQVQESNSPISYIYSGQRVAKIQDGNTIYFTSDNVGSTSIETDSTGNINFKANYLPFGKELSFSSIGKEKYGFTSKEYDAESSLNYFNARYYNPSNGKFISIDPIFKPTEGGYQYVNNNPLTITDPSGKDGCRNGACPIPSIGKLKESKTIGGAVRNTDWQDVKNSFNEPNTYMAGHSLDMRNDMGPLTMMGLKMIFTFASFIDPGYSTILPGTSIKGTIEYSPKIAQKMMVIVEKLTKSGYSDKQAFRIATKFGQREMDILSTQRIEVGNVVETIGNARFRALSLEHQNELLNIREEIRGSTNLKRLVDILDNAVNSGYLSKRITENHILYNEARMSNNGERIRGIYSY